MMSPLLSTLRLSALAGLLLAPVALEAQDPRPPRGYQARACGFDMDRDGVWSEPEDCQVCDGVTLDPDHDGQNEDLIYIDCDAGADVAVCGGAGSPCRTLDYAWNQRADGPADGAEDILCFRGVCRTESFVGSTHGGVPGIYRVPASGSQVRDWEYPSDPTMLVGWDSDRDGAYPPVDTDDVAVVDGRNGLERAFKFDHPSDYLEMAHFTVQDYGRFTTAGDTGFIGFGTHGGILSHLFIHDLDLLRINMDRATTSSTSAINIFTSHTRPQWVQFANLQVLDNGQWFTRGQGREEAPDFGPFRFTNITRTAHSCDFAVCGSSAGTSSFKLWGYLTGVEILDSVWDANVGAWQPKPEGGPSGATFANVAQCSQDWMVRNNEVIDHKIAFKVEGHANGICNAPAARPTDEIHFDGNLVRNTYEPWRYGDHGIRIQDGGSGAGEVVGNVYITNNFMASTTGWEATVWSDAGHETTPPTGTIVIANNTFYGNVNRHGAIVIGNPEGSDLPFPHQRYVLQNNIFGAFIATNNGERDLNIRATYAPSALVADGNVYDPTGQFIWNDGGRMELAGWRAATGEDAASQRCDPLMRNPGAGDFHLLPGDTCALDRGIQPSPVAFDIDGQPRGQLAGVDVGADELSADVFSDNFETGTTNRWSFVLP
ncbi:MAG: hypothetical protein AAGN66_24935 [Acidobacteriota bacterium]